MSRPANRPRSAGSFFWGLILIAAGSVFLLRNLGYDVPVWTGIARYWPVLLIVWGLIKLIDYTRWKRAGEPGPLFGAGEVVLLIVVIMSGTALTAAANMSPDFGSLFEMANIDLWDITGNSYHFTEHYEKEARSGSAIEIINRYGTVEVTPADTDRIIVDVDKTVIATDQNEANELSKVLTYSIAEGDGSYRVISNYNRDSNRVRGRRFKTSLTIKVPKRSSINVDNRNGNVEVSGLTGDQIVMNVFGRVALSRITGKVNVNNRNDSVSVEDISGDTVIANEFANIEARRIGGELEIRLRNGSVDVESVKRDAKISNAFGSINAKDLLGALTIDARMTSVDVKGVEGDTSVEDQFQSVQLEDVKGAITLNNKNGQIDVKFHQPPRKNIQVTSQFADVTVTLPSSSAFSIDARARFAQVTSDFPELRRSDRDERGEGNSLTGQVGTGGPEIRIDNRNGSIRIEK
jgi:predicted HAD superfamily phosphohydrolase YqeG